MSNHTRLHARAALLLAFLGLHAHVRGADDAPIVLSPFEVTEGAEDRYSASQTNTGTLVAKPRDEIPFVTSVLTSNVIEDLKLQNPSDFATQFAGVARGNSDQFLNDGAQLGSGTGFTVRGFTTSPLYNGFQTGSLNVAADGVGRVEVTKGANSILYGQSSAGGTINFVPKEALRSGSMNAFSVGASTNDGYRGTFETGGAVAGRQGTGFRLGGGYQEHTREQQFYWNSQASMYGAFRTNLTDRATLEVNVEVNRTKTSPARTEAFVSLGSGPDRVTDPNNRLRNDRNFNYHGPWSFRKGQAGIVSGYLTTRIQDGLTLRLGGLYSNQSEEADSADGLYGLGTGTTATGYYQNAFRDAAVTGFKADLLHQTELRGFRLDSIIGFESHESRARSELVRTNPAVTPITVSIPFDRKPVASDWPRQPARSLYTSLASDSSTKLWWTNLRFTQFVTAPESRATLMWGVARGEGENTARDFRTNGKSVATGEDTTYTIGGTYVLRSTDEGKWTAFANTSTSFLIQGGNRQNPADFTGFTSIAALRAYVATVQPNAIDPQTGEGYEVGVRYSRNDGRLRVEVLAYEQKRTNISRDFFVRESNVIGEPSEQVIATYQLASGVEESKGIEISFNWNPTAEFGIFASGLLSDGEVVSNDQAPEEVGFQLVRSPEKMYNVWARYAAKAGPLQGFVFGAGATYRQETRTLPTLPDRFRLSDAYTFARAMVAYEFGTDARKHTITLNVENLLDEEYVAENAILSEPLITRLTYSLKW
jgi:iron complex outermembrane receptor protein